MWCWEGCGSTIGFPALAGEKPTGLGQFGAGRRGGRPQMALGSASLCSLLSPGACLSAGVRPLPPQGGRQERLCVLKILFRKHRGNFSCPFPFPGIVDPMKELTPLLLVTKWLVDMSPLTAVLWLLSPSSWVPEVGADLLTLPEQPCGRAPGPCGQGLEELTQPGSDGGPPHAPSPSGALALV